MVFCYMNFFMYGFGFPLHYSICVDHEWLCLVSVIDAHKVLGEVGDRRLAASSPLPSTAP
eukprot:c13566_g1_i2 orf=2-178(-)